MVDSLVVACCNAQAAQTDDSDLALAQGQVALNELRDLGWDEEVWFAFRRSSVFRGLCPKARLRALKRKG